MIPKKTSKYKFDNNLYNIGDDKDKKDQKAVKLK